MNRSNDEKENEKVKRMDARGNCILAEALSEATECMGSEAVGPYCICNQVQSIRLGYQKELAFSVEIQRIKGCAEGH